MFPCVKQEVERSSLGKDFTDNESAGAPVKRRSPTGDCLSSQDAGRMKGCT